MLISIYIKSLRALIFYNIPKAFYFHNDSFFSRLKLIFLLKRSGCIFVYSVQFVSD